MDLQHFTVEMGTLSSFFNRKITPAQTEIYFDRLKSIPNKVFSEAVISVIDTSSFFPKPKDLLQFWWDWKREHAQDIAMYPRTHCPECDGDGFIEYIDHISGGYVDVRLVRCAKCNNWRGKIGTFVPAMTKASLREKGFSIIEKYEDRHIKPDPVLYPNLYPDDTPAEEACPF